MVSKNKFIRKEELMNFLRVSLFALCLGLIFPAFADSLPIPPRPDDALSGSEFVTLITPMEREDREQAVVEQVRLGNVPDFYRELVPVSVTANVGGQNRTLVFQVAPEYLCIGSEEDYFLCPLTPNTAQVIADELGCTLPTARMVDAIYSAATVKLAPSPIPPSEFMTTVPVFDEHNDTVRGQRQAVTGAHPLGELVGGHKKDVVITARLATVGDKVAIYGWHQLNGQPIQPLYTGHTGWYVDYSHGIRFIPWAVTIDGAPNTVARVLANPDLRALISTEGAFTSSHYPIPPATDFPYRDVFPATGRTQNWTDRFRTATVAAFDPIDPQGDGFALQVRDPSGGIETVALGSQTDSNYFVESRLYCNYRPELSDDGFERIGLFVRDDGGRLFEGESSSGIPGNNYALTWDSHDGRIRCLKTVDGEPQDLVAPVVRDSSGWRTFRIAVFEDRLWFYVDGALVDSATDSTFSSGVFGIGYHEYFSDNQNITGTWAENFQADSVDSVSDAMISIY
jgi:hypothetical protein